MFQMFHMDVVMVVFRCCTCCNGYTRMLHEFVQNVSSVLDECCKCFYLDVAYVAMAMLQIYVLNILSVLDVCHNCFI